MLERPVSNSDALKASAELLIVCEAACLSVVSDTASAGPVHNPFADGYSAGGSSSGCARLVAMDLADMAIGTDQGG